MGLHCGEGDRDMDAHKGKVQVKPRLSGLGLWVDNGAFHQGKEWEEIQQRNGKFQVPGERSHGDVQQVVEYLGLDPRREGGLVHRSKSGSHELIGRDESDRLGGSPAGSVQGEQLSKWSKERTLGNNTVKE